MSRFRIAGAATAAAIALSMSAATAEAQQGQNRSNQVRSDQTQSDQAQAGQGQTTPGEAQQAQASASQGNPAKTRSKQPEFGFGKPAPQSLIDAWAIAIPPDGEHLPPGGAMASDGHQVYEQNCAACHGEDLHGIESQGPALIGGRGTLDSDHPDKTVESYWPYATTLFDYVRRAMPFTSPGSLSDQQVYAVTAYVLYRADIIGRGDRIDARTLPQVKMPNRDGFISPDPRPDVHDYR